MIGLKNLYSKISYNLLTGVKSPSNTASIPTLDFSGKIYNNNLAPLKADTITFAGRKDAPDASQNARRQNEVEIHSPRTPLFSPPDVDVKIYHGASSTKNSVVDNAAKAMNYRAFGAYKDLLPLASEVHKEAKRLEKHFDIKMSIFDSMINTEDPKAAKPKPLAMKQVRVKSSQSIANKMSSKVAKLIELNDDFPVMVSRAMIKSEIQDLLGARLILEHGSMAEMNAVINRLIESIETGNGPKIKRIKNYGSSIGSSYLTKTKAEKLEQANYRAYGHYPVTENKRKTSGYTATHIVFEVENGIGGEIQILGRGVARVKEIDDICYKGLQGKPLKGLTEISKALKMVKENQKLKMEFDKYLTSAYKLAKSEWDKMPENELMAQKFPSINTEVLPACLDLNNIEAALKERASKTARKS